jgi:hypothetical protein
VECAGPAEYVITVYGKPDEILRLAHTLGQDPELHDPQVVEDVGQTNVRLYQAADAGSRGRRSARSRGRR